MTAYALNELLPWLAGHGTADLDRPIDWFQDSRGTLHASSDCLPHLRVSDTPCARFPVSEITARSVTVCSEMRCLVPPVTGLVPEQVGVLSDVRSTATGLRARVRRDMDNTLAPAYRTSRQFHLAFVVDYQIGRLVLRVGHNGRDLDTHPAVVAELASLRELHAELAVPLPVMLDAIARTAATERLSGFQEVQSLHPAELVRYSVTLPASPRGRDVFQLTPLPDTVRHRFSVLFLSGHSVRACADVLHDELHDAVFDCRYRSDDFQPLGRDDLVDATKRYVTELAAAYDEVLADNAPWVLPTWRLDTEGRETPLEAFCLAANVYHPGGYRGAVVAPRFVYRYLHAKLKAGRRLDGAPCPDGVSVDVLDTTFSLMDGVDRDCELSSFPAAFAAASKL